MYPTKTKKEKIQLFLQLFFPLLIYQFANYSASFIDTMMTGQYSTTDLAGVSMAGSLWNPFFSFATGVISALVPIVGQHLGSGDKQKVRAEFYQFLYLALGLALGLLVVIAVGAIPLLEQFDLEKAVLGVAQSYLGWILLGVIPFLLFSLCRSFFDAIGLTRLSMYLMLLLVPFNSLFNAILIYGHFGFPEMGGAGAGLGTALAYWSLLLVVVLVMKYHPAVSQYELWKRQKLEKSLLFAGFRLGLPIGLQVFAEVAIFAVVGLFMASFSSTVIAAHQAAMNFATLMYAFPVSVSMALPIVVAYEVGAHRYQDAKEYSTIGRVVALLFAFFTLSFLFIFRGKIASLYGSNPAFLELTAVFLTYSLFFQLADTFTAPLQGILRGYKDTTYPFVLGVSSYWSVSLPVGWLLDHVTSLGAAAYWVGLTAGILVCGLLLQLRLKKVERQVSIVKD